MAGTYLQYSSSGTLRVHVCDLCGVMCNSGDISIYRDMKFHIMI